MKKSTHILALAAVLMAFAAPAFAQSKIITFPRLGWTRGISSYGLGVDSTRISIPSRATGVADFVDTTAWFNVGDLNLNQNYAKQPLVLFQINRQLAAGTDSVTYQVQYSNDLSTVNGASGAGLFGTGSAASIVTVSATTAGITSGTDGLVGTVVAVSPDAIAQFGTGTATTLPWRWVRLVVTNDDASTAAGRVYFSVTPVVYGAR